MIWSTTTHVGMALATSRSGTTYVVARYSPPGNRIGKSPTQALNSGGARTPTQGRHHRRGPRDNPRRRDSGGGIQPQFQQPHQYQQPGHMPPDMSAPPPQPGLVGPYDYASLLANPNISISPYNTFGDFPLPVHPVSAMKPAPRSYCFCM
jgi:hypothetical protein